MDSFNINIGKKLNEMLKAEQMTISELSKELNIPHSTLWGYFQNCYPRKIEHLYKLCQRFAISSDELLFGKESLTKESCHDQLFIARIKIIKKIKGR